jgi:ATP-dependent protease Clp ATPase subunit
MFARVTVVEGLANQWDRAKELLKTQAMPRTRELRGCCASYWLGDPKTGKVLAVALYITEKELRASADTVATMKQELIPQAGGRLVSVDEYEVIAQEPGTGES